MYEDVCYMKNNISEVICRLDMATIMEPIKRTMPKTIFEVVRKYYPVAEPQDIIGTEMKINPTNPLNVPIVNQVINKQWVFLSVDRKNKCVIGSEGITFTVSNYNIFEDFKDALIAIIDVIMAEYPEIQGKRFGLRYINKFMMNDTEQWIDSKFYTALSAHKDEKTTKLITQLEYAVWEKDLNVRLVYGYSNPDYPATIKRNEFIIDIDAFSQGIIYREDICKYIENMHGEVQKCFEEMITDEYRKELGIVK